MKAFIIFRVRDLVLYRVLQNVIRVSVNLLFRVKIRVLKLKERRHDNNLHICVSVVSDNVVTHGIFWMNFIESN